uniref:Uncharacterized protein n=1 Tax=Arundo donax TaxID=35708 RepID=A0A0A9MIR1_ARUDO
MAAVTWIALRNPSRHWDMTISSSLWSSGTLKAASIGAQQTSTMNFKTTTSVAG